MLCFEECVANCQVTPGNHNMSDPVTPTPPPCPDPVKPQVSRRAKIRGLPQLGTLGAGNHYAEIQVVEEIFDQQAAKKMGIDRVNQVRGPQAARCWVGLASANNQIRRCKQ